MKQNNLNKFFTLFITSLSILFSHQSIAKETLNSPHLRDTAIVQGLNKITAKTSLLEIKIGETIQFGQIAIIAHKCWQAPLDQAPESKILLEVLQNKSNNPNEKVRIFYGWMFASAPSVSTLEHPIYDITAINCKNQKS